MINAKETLTGVIHAKQTLTGVLNKAIEYVNPVTQEKEVTPTKEVQEVTPDENYTGLSKVIVNAYEPVVGEKKITSNGVYKANDEDLDGYSEVEVDVTGGDNIWDYYVKSGTYSEIRCYITSIPPIDTSSVNNMNSMFQYCYNLTSIPPIDTSSVTSMYNMFQYCYNLTTIPLIDTSSVNNMNSMFQYCSNLTSIPPIDTSSVINMGYMFSSCYNLTSIPLIDTSNVNNVNYMFNSCSKLTDLGGLKNLGQAYSTTSSANNTSYKLNLSKSTKLTHDSLMNVINNLYDIKNKGCNAQQLVLGSTNLAKLTEEEIAIATEKGWSVS